MITVGGQKDVQVSVGAATCTTSSAPAAAVAVDNLPSLPSSAAVFTRASSASLGYS